MTAQSFPLKLKDILERLIREEGNTVYFPALWVEPLQNLPWNPFLLTKPLKKY